MPLSAGDKLGPYEIIAPIGAGGMGEVYRAHDTKLKRDVALKVLPEAFARDPDRLARFEREAEVLASLNHPNIAAIYGVVEDRALVMELVEGSEPKGPLPFDEAWAIMSQVAAALEYAHDKGVVHRDLKPTNIKVTPDGVVKLLDFGLAKAFSSQADSQASPENSPTLTIGATQAGVILGTAAYMSPEQAKGKSVDKRADIWAFGVVLYELLTGERLFKGEDVSETLAQVLTKQPDWKKVPPKARRLVKECLEKEPKQRLRDIGDARRSLLEDAYATATAQSRPSWIGWGAAALLLVALGLLSFVHFREASPPRERSVRFQVLPPEKFNADALRLSPDGRYLAIVAGGRLWVRPLDSLDAAKTLPGSDGASFPFWSPDGEFIGFFGGGKLKKVSVGGGPSQILCEASGGRGGTWNRNGVILFAAGLGALYRVPAAGGVPIPVTKTTGSHRFPEFLPDGLHFLFLARESPDTSGISVGSLDGASPVHLLSDDSNAEYVPQAGSSHSGYLVFLRQTTVMAQAFDTEKLRLSGEMFPLAERTNTISGTSGTGYGQFSTSNNGVLTYGNAGGASRELVWVNRAGKQMGSAFQGGDFPDFRLAPDQNRVAFSRLEAGNQDIWVRDVQRGVTSRLSFDPAPDNMPIWSPDGLRILWPSNRNGGVYNLYIKSATGTGQEEFFIKMGTPTGWATDWSRDGRFIILQMPGAKNGQDLWIAPVSAGKASGDEKPFPLFQGSFDEQSGVFSPDGRWIAYVSNESGKDEVYVQPFPLSGGKWQISTNGGSGPKWRDDGTELFYVAADRDLMVTAVRVAQGTFQPGVPKHLFPIPLVPWVVSRDEFAVSADASRFLISRPVAETRTNPITVVLNWQAGLKK